MEPWIDPPDKTEEHRTEMDSHADQCCVGDNAHIYYVWPGITVEVGPFLSLLGCVPSAPIVMAGVVYDDPTTGRPVLIIIYQTIYIKGLKHNLLCPMQLRHNGITVNERPKHCTPIPTREDHSIVFEDGKYFIPLSIHGVTSYFPTRTPTTEEALKFEEAGDYLELTSDASEWEPNSTRFSELESRLIDRYGELKEGITSNIRQLFPVVTDRDLYKPFRKLKIYATSTKHPGT